MGKVNRRRRLLPGIVLALAALRAQGAPGGGHNVVLFVADGLRAGSVAQAPQSAFAHLARAGVAFPNSHALFPTFTTANASALATGHLLGDTGDFANVIFTGPPLDDHTSPLPFLEDDGVLRLLDRRFAGNYLGEETVVEAAARGGHPVAVVGKLGPAAIFAPDALAGGPTVVVDDWMGRDDKAGIALPADVAAQLRQLSIDPAAAAPSTPNQAQQQQFVDIATRVVLPRLARGGKPFLLVFWSRDPDFTQHKQTDDRLGGKPVGINGKTSALAIDNAGQDLAALRRALEQLGIAASTDVIVTADHGFSSIDRQAHGSRAASFKYPDVQPPETLPPGFLAIDLAAALQLPLFDPDSGFKRVAADQGVHPARSSAFIGADPQSPQVVVAGNGGSDLVYLPGAPAQRRGLAQKIVAFLLTQEYVSGIFAADDLGRLPSTLPLSAIGLRGSALTPAPALVVSFLSRPALCGQNPELPQDPELCAVEVADTALGQDQGMHGSFSRADTHNFMAAAGPDFKSGYVDPMPASNADLGCTIADILRLKPRQRGKLRGRVLAEAYVGGKERGFSREVVRAPPADPQHAGLATVLVRQRVGGVEYFDVAGFPGRSVGLEQAIAAAAAKP